MKKTFEQVFAAKLLVQAQRDLAEAERLAKRANDAAKQAEFDKQAEARARRRKKRK